MYPVALFIYPQIIKIHRSVIRIYKIETLRHSRNLRLKMRLLFTVGDKVTYQQTIYTFIFACIW